jgi:hypothetical protein
MERAVKPQYLVEPQHIEEYFWKEVGRLIRLFRLHPDYPKFMNLRPQGTGVETQDCGGHRRLIGHFPFEMRVKGASDPADFY